MVGFPGRSSTRSATGVMLGAYVQVHTEEIAPETLSDVVFSEVSERSDALRVGDDTELVHELAQWALQQLIEADAAASLNPRAERATFAGVRQARPRAVLHVGSHDVGGQARSDPRAGRDERGLFLLV